MILFKERTRAPTGTAMSEEDALWMLWDQFNRLTTPEIRVNAKALAVVGGDGLVPSTYKGGATVLVGRCALFEHLKNFCAGDFPGS